MDLDAAISEPYVSLIAFHNQFNRNIKFSFGALEALRAGEPSSTETAVVQLPTGSEPWGRSTSWRDIEFMIKSAEAFIAEIGIVRAASAFDDYLTGVTAELDRFNGGGKSIAADSRLSRFATRVGLNRTASTDELAMGKFFDCARNCIVHRSGKASDELAGIARSKVFQSAISRWPKRKGKWKVALPDIVPGQPVPWQPRHAILASDGYHRLAGALDKCLIAELGIKGIVGMAAHWCLLADAPAPFRAKLNPHVIIRDQLATRYKAGNPTITNVAKSLRNLGKWDDVRKAYELRFPDGPRPKRK